MARVVCQTTADGFYAGFIASFSTRRDLSGKGSCCGELGSGLSRDSNSEEGNDERA
jgi:hypothetical protein